MSAEGHVKLYNKEMFIQGLQDVMRKNITSAHARRLVEQVLEIVERYYTFGEYVIRYVEYGTSTWECVDWLHRAIYMYFRNGSLLRQYDVLYLIGQLEVALRDAEVKDIQVWRL